MRQSFTERLKIFYDLREMGWAGIDVSTTPTSFLMDYDAIKIMNSFCDSRGYPVTSIQDAYDNVTLADVVSWTSSCIDASSSVSSFIAMCLVKVYRHKTGLSQEQVLNLLSNACNDMVDDEFWDLPEDNSSLENFITTLGFREDQGFMTEFGNRLDDKDWLIDLQSFWDTNIYLYEDNLGLEISDLTSNVIIGEQLWSICQSLNRSPNYCLNEFHTCIDFITEFPMYKNLLQLSTMSKVFRTNFTSVNDVLCKVTKPGSFNRLNLVLKRSEVVCEEIVLMWLKANLVNERLLDTDPNEIAVMSVDDLDGYLSNFDRETLDVMVRSLSSRALKGFDNPIPQALSRYPQDDDKRSLVVAEATPVNAFV